MATTRWLRINPTDAHMFVMRRDRNGNPYRSSKTKCGIGFRSYEERMAVGYAKDHTGAYPEGTNFCLKCTARKA